MVVGVCGLVLSLVGLAAAGALVAGLGPSRTGADAAPRSSISPTPTKVSTTSPSLSPTPPPTPAASTPTPVAKPALQPTPPLASPPAAAASPPARNGSGAAAATLYAVTSITDGDTIKVRVGGVTERVRLIGLDAPELKGNECWSQKASSKMQSLVQSRSVQLVRDRTQADRDRYGRLLRHVVTEDGRLVAQVLIEGGFAKEYTYAAAYEHRADYLAAQKRAKAQRLGVWSSACAAPVVVTPPRTGTVAPVKPSGGCVIKGNISSSGEKIYHVPGGGSYDVTVITASKGEQWFCTEQQAVDAGWRKARN